MRAWRRLFDLGRPVAHARSSVSDCGSAKYFSTASSTKS
jgi:hypothetical protein